jgi:putative Holliday junction resolvase
LSLEKEVDN